ncbi:hypothetical protein HMPREF0501_00459 [Limosilactobacillus coleohominis 101-4-CHN]|uniref:Uncharacterized protein n=1 Tax=Limosilactobacillus coleohominis 101-4-CHN TaxID=575594 RepID=C7XUU3_9LACO|nr:hypothetical protein [Limosilactobacillus coleohominis]EEU31054.1 hypothetical protein HMPREF0501_00459 [Limosilactobacillus coleohominis 101-4-CHN]
MNNQETNWQELDKNLRRVSLKIRQVLQQIALRSVKKREKQEVEKALLTTVDKRKRAHDDFHKFVRSL